MIPSPHSVEFNTQQKSWWLWHTPCSVFSFQFCHASETFPFYNSQGDSKSHVQCYMIGRNHLEKGSSRRLYLACGRVLLCISLWRPNFWLPGWTGRWALSGNSASTVQRADVFNPGPLSFCLCGHWDGKSLSPRVRLSLQIHAYFSC